jgi:hypothetical protein
MGAGDKHRALRWLNRGALLVYGSWAILLISQNPGLQYDEALLVLGSVHLRHSRSELPLPHDPDTWLCLPGRCLPLMTVRYVGAIKEYLCLPLFAVFGTRAVVVRMASMFLGLLGIWGISRFLYLHVSPSVGVLTAWVIAMNPAYTDLTVFDNGAVAIWMGAMGGLAFAASRYLSRRSLASAWWFGFAMGVGVWARANFLWLIAAILGSVFFVLGRRALVPMKELAAIVIGGLVGGSPFLLYQWLSGGGTLQAIGMFSSSKAFRDLILGRLTLLSEVLLTDREHRAMWDGPQIGEWQRWLFVVIVVAASAVCLTARRRAGHHLSFWARMFGVQFLLLAGFMTFSRLNVAEHHLIALVPLAAVVVVVGSAILARSSRWTPLVLVAVALAYSGCALFWQVKAIYGLHASGGVGQWSDAIFPLADHIRKRYSRNGVEVKILDWGLQNNLYVLSDAAIKSREIFWDADREGSGPNRSWTTEISEGGVFLLNAAGNRNFPAASVGFLEALHQNPRVHRSLVRQRNGRPYAEIIEIAPERREPNPWRSVADSSLERQLEGFHQVEEGRWRWTKQRFSIILDPPGSSDGHTQVALEIFIPDHSIQRLGALTLSAHVGNRSLGGETYRTAGKYVFVRSIGNAWLHTTPRIDFSVDKCLPPTSLDKRELGLIVVALSIKPD